ncbi:MAG: hypothetical protein H6662_08640 [Ardenticatenaceae bacterium]|nr:hypothetical protein [Anaerolineales bacterium]MCB8921635.1 hypothetical protein [Ardenticatenaceae bacterium]MCB9003333.1 hypothetical protein [Ardenticatenaceae bacterium]
MSDTGKLTQPTHYQAYLVRLWREDNSTPWRVTVKHVLTQEQHHFASLEDYVVFLMRQTGGDGER